MSFDEIPENLHESYPCPTCRDGEVTKNEKHIWECNCCEFTHHDEKEG